MAISMAGGDMRLLVIKRRIVHAGTTCRPSYQYPEPNRKQTRRREMLLGQHATELHVQASEDSCEAGDKL